MPTYEREPRFRREFRCLPQWQQEAFLAIMPTFVDGLRQGRFDSSLLVKRIQHSERVWELVWEAGWRATFEYGPEIRPGEPHVIWRRIGTYDDLPEPQVARQPMS